MLFVKLSAFYFFYFASIGVYIIFLPKVLDNIGYTPSQIGIVLALAPLMKFLTPFLFLKHIKLDANIFKIALLIATISTFLFKFTIANFYLFMLNDGILGICLSMILPYVEIIALSNLGKNRYGKSRLFGSIGFMLIGLILAKYLTVSLALDYYLFTTIATAIFSYILTNYDIQYKPLKDDNNFSLFRFWPFWLSLFLMQVSFGSFYSFFTIYETAHGISLQTTSYLWAFGVICEIIMLYFQAPLLKNNLLKIINISILLTAFRWYLLYIYPNNLYISYFTQSLHAVSFALYYSANIIYLYTLYSNKKLAQQFMFGITYGLGGFVGALLAGYSYGKYLFLISSIIAIFSFISLNIKSFYKTKS